jgi:hypothetical protein
MNRLLKPLKKIGSLAGDIKNKNIHKFSRFNIYCQDESRFGLLTLAHKALTIKGVKPICNYQHKFDNTYLFGAFSPINGNHLILELPQCNCNMFQTFLDEFSMLDKEEFKIVLLDKGAFHHAKSLMIPKNIALIFLPPYSPELNPAEKVWWMIKRELKMKLFKTMKELQNAITIAVQKICTDHRIKQLTAFECYLNII